MAGNFNNNGQTSLVTTSTMIYNPQVNPGNLKTYLSIGPGAFAAPALIPNGDDPLFLASADLNGDNLPDVVSTSYSGGTLAVFFNSAQTPGTFSTPLSCPLRARRRLPSATSMATACPI